MHYARRPTPSSAWPDRQTNGAVESPGTPHAVKELIAAASHLLGVLNGVLGMAKIEAGKCALSRESFSMPAGWGSGQPGGARFLS